MLRGIKHWNSRSNDDGHRRYLTTSYKYPIRINTEWGTLPSGPAEAAQVKRKVISYSVIEGSLYGRNLLNPMLKYLKGEEASYTFTKVHEGIAKQHLGAHALAKKVLRTCWSSMVQDAKYYLMKCDDQFKKH